MVGQEVIAFRPGPAGGEAIGDTVAGIEHHLLGGRLGLAVERDGSAGSFLVANVVGNGAVDTARRGEEELLVGLAVRELAV